MKALSAEEYLDISRQEVAEAADKIMADFDFERAALAVAGCNWKYEGAEGPITIAELKVIAKKILHRAIQSGSGCTVHQGPLQVNVRHYDTPAVCTATLSLIPVWKSAVYIDGRVIYAKKHRDFTSARKPKGKSIK